MDKGEMLFIKINEEINFSHVFFLLVHSLLWNNYRFYSTVLKLQCEKKTASYSGKTSCK